MQIPFRKSCVAVVATLVSGAFGTSALGANPDRDAYFGETHVHTSWSLDAWLLGNRMTGPADAYKYFKGEPIKHPAGYDVKIVTPLDWAGVTDHSEYVGVIKYANDPTSALSKVPAAQPLKIDPNKPLSEEVVLSVAAFAWAYLLGAGDVTAFAIVCALSGIAYGAELAIPPSILADIVDRDPARHRPDGAYFGVWQMIDKLNLALAAGLALPLLQWLGYTPGIVQPAQTTLSLIYALVPCIIKLAAIVCLWLAPLQLPQRLPAALNRTGACTP